MFLREKRIGAYTYVYLVETVMRRPTVDIPVASGNDWGRLQEIEIEQDGKQGSEQLLPQLTCGPLRPKRRSRRPRDATAADAAEPDRRFVVSAEQITKCIR
jgi:hypothetical protein